jgi:ABC-2 type transport system permease protein
MIRSYHAELTRLLRGKLVVITLLASTAFAMTATAIVMSTVEPVAQIVGGGPGRTLTVEDLADAGGGTEVFRFAASFAGTFLFVVFVAVMALELTRGTMRTMLLRQPRRLRLLGGRLAAMLTFAAVTLACTEVITWITARLLAPGADVVTDAWTSMDALGSAFVDFGAVLIWITGYAVLGTALAVMLRSAAVALAVGVAWAGPIEHILQDGWEPAVRYFPGLLLEAFVAGGTDEVGAGRALATVAAYCAVAVAVAAVVFSRRDVTA